MWPDGKTSYQAHWIEDSMGAPWCFRVGSRSVFWLSSTGTHPRCKAMSGDRVTESFDIFVELGLGTGFHWTPGLRTGLWFDIVALWPVVIWSLWCLGSCRSKKLTAAVPPTLSLHWQKSVSSLIECLFDNLWIFLSIRSHPSHPALVPHSIPSTPHNGVFLGLLTCNWLFVSRFCEF